LSKKCSLPGIRAFFDLVLGMKEVISLGVGEPDFVTPGRSVRPESILWSRVLPAIPPIRGSISYAWESRVI